MSLPHSSSLLSPSISMKRRRCCGSTASIVGEVKMHDHNNHSGSTTTNTNTNISSSSSCSCSNDCYDDLWNVTTTPMDGIYYHNSKNHSDNDEIQQQFEEDDKQQQQQYYYPVLVRSSWFHHVRWICSSSSDNNDDNNNDDDIQQYYHNDDDVDDGTKKSPQRNNNNNNKYENENLWNNVQGKKNEDNTKMEIDLSSSPPSSSNMYNHHDDDGCDMITKTNINNNNIETSKMLHFMIQHLHEQLLQVKCRLQPAIERYQSMMMISNVGIHKSSSSSSSYNNNNNHNNNNIFHIARRYCNPYEVLGEGQNYGLNQYLFMNRSAIKLVNIDAILDFTLMTKTTTSSSSLSSTKDFKFCDLCGAPGGFSEYILWRLHQNYNNNKRKQHHNEPTTNIISSCRGYGMSLMGQNEHGYGLPWKLHDTYYRPNNIGNNSNCAAFQSSYKICYGIDGTGDVYNWDNVISLQEMIYNDDMAAIQGMYDDNTNSNDSSSSSSNDNGKVHLVVVDGGFDAQRNTGYQEELSLKLVVNETAAALSLLCTSGTFVIKLFGFQTSIVRNMMTHLFMSFDRIIAIKPISSRPASAERYVVCYGYHGHPPTWSGQRWCNDLYLDRACSVMNYASSDINYVEKETKLLRYLDEFDRDMCMLNLKASFAILSYIERKYLQIVISNDSDDSDVSESTETERNDPCESDFDNVQPRVDIPMYRAAWQLER